MKLPEASDNPDVAIIGCGPVGAAAALGLADAGRRVALIDKKRPPPQLGRFGGDLRAMALSPASQALLAELDLWQRLRPTPYRLMRVWEERGTAELRFDAAEAGRAELGWIQESGPLSEAAWARLAEHPNVELLLGESPSAVTPTPPAVALQVGRRRLSAALLIVADGAQSPVRRQLGVKAQAWDPQQVAIASIVRTSRGHANTAWQRFLLDGPVALLPCADAQTAALVWSQSPAAAERRMALTEAAFCAELTCATEACQGEVEAVDRRLRFPLAQSVARTFSPHHRVLLIGDAARVVHPLAGLGLNLGFEDVSGLLRTAKGALDPGAPGLWRTFARRRRARALGMAHFLSALQGFYGLSQPAVGWLRNIGVRMVNNSAPIKRQLISEALGLGPLAQRLR